jgi:ABC-type Fe3+-hydroxamate transport system substrate-binding protein
MFQKLERIGGTKKLNIKRILELQPDIIIGNKEENTKSEIKELEKHCPIWMSDVNSFDHAIEMIIAVSEITDTVNKGREISNSINLLFDEIPTINKTALYLIWKNPYMVVGKNTFIDAILSKVGYTNVITETRYPELDIEKIRKLNPDIIFLSTEPFPFNTVDIESIQKVIPNSNVILVDGEMFTWYGSRMLKAADYIKKINLTFF